MQTSTCRELKFLLDSDSTITDDQKAQVLAILQGKDGIKGPLYTEALKEVREMIEGLSTQKEYMRREEAARFLGCSIRVIDRKLADGSLPYYRLSARMILLRRADLEDFMERHRVDALRWGRRRRKSSLSAR